MTNRFPPTHCYRNALMFGLDLANQELAKALEKLPKRKRTRQARKRLSDAIAQHIFIVHGSVNHDFGYRIRHAWVEYEGLAYDPTLSILAPLEEWYAGDTFFDAIPPPGTDLPIRVGHAVANVRYPLMVALRTALRHTAGPWTEDEIEWT